MHAPLRRVSGIKASQNWIDDSTNGAPYWPNHRPLTKTLSDCPEETGDKRIFEQKEPKKTIRSKMVLALEHNMLSVDASPSVQCLPVRTNAGSKCKMLTKATSSPDLREGNKSFRSHQNDSGFGSESASNQGSTDGIILHGGSGHIDESNLEFGSSSVSCFDLDFFHASTPTQTRSVDNQKLNQYTEDESAFKYHERESCIWFEKENMDNTDHVNGPPIHSKICKPPERNELENTLINVKDEKVGLAAPDADPISRNHRFLPFTNWRRKKDVQQSVCYGQKRSEPERPIPGKKISKETLCQKYTSCRWVLAYLCFLARFMQTALRNSLSIAIIGMTMENTKYSFVLDGGSGVENTTNIIDVDNSELSDATVMEKGIFSRIDAFNSSLFPDQNRSNNTKNIFELFLKLAQDENLWWWTNKSGFTWKMVEIKHAEFEWSSAFEGVILASFSAGSLITPVIVGYLTCRYGGRKLMAICFFVGGMFTVLLPVAATFHPALIIVFRVITGAALSGTDSLIQAMWARWAPKYEKASLTTVGFTGMSVSGAVTYLICGYLSAIGGDGQGWRNIFYVFGSLGVMLAPLWWYFVHDSPELHPRLTKTEFSIITLGRTKSSVVPLMDAPLNPQWRRILRSPAVWVILMGHISNKWVTAFMMSYMPRFVTELFNHNFQTESLFASLPFVGRIFSGLVAAMLSDWMLRKGVATAATRKTFQALGNWSCGLCTLGLAFLPMDRVSSLVVLIAALTMQNTTSVAYKINLLDIAPRYAGLLNGVISTVSTLVALPCPVITSILVADGSKQGWQAAFCLVAAVTTFSGLSFLLFAQGEVQDWALAPKIVSEAPELGAAVISTGQYCANITLNDRCSLSYQSMVPSENVSPDVLKFQVREMRSLPPDATKRDFEKIKPNLRRSTTLDVSALVKTVKLQAFSNLPFSDI